MFEDLNTRSILNQVPAKLQGEAARSLWRRIDSEFSSDGGPAVGSYLTSQFDEIRTNLRAALAVVKDSLKGAGA